MKTVFENLPNMFVNFLKHFIYAIGYFGEQISFLWCCFITITYSHVYFIVFLTIFILNKIFNQILKDWIQQLRPSNSQAFLKDEIISKENYGMPSGHTQTTTYNLLFAYLVSGTKLFESILLLSIVILQRLLFKNHTFLQLIVGIALGGIIAYITYFMAKHVKQKIDLNKNKHQKETFRSQSSFTTK